jgi:hypothetical protein
VLTSALGLKWPSSALVPPFVLGGFEWTQRYAALNVVGFAVS